MMKNPLDDYPRVRKVLYFLQWLTTGATGVLGVIFAAREAAVPEWYTVTVAALAFVWTYTGRTAETNVDTDAPVTDERGAIDVGMVVVIALLALIFLTVAGLIRFG